MGAAAGNSVVSASPCRSRREGRRGVDGAVSGTGPVLQRTPSVTAAPVGQNLQSFQSQSGALTGPSRSHWAVEPRLVDPCVHMADHSSAAWGPHPVYA